MRNPRLLLPVLLLATLVGQAPGEDKPADRPAPLFDNLGSHHHAVSTRSKMAQRYFDQGLILVYGFNHHEAIRSFRAAAQLDPGCAMAHWGIALAHGPNINAPMTAEAVPEAWKALQEALKLAAKASPRERAYIEALAKRYVEKPVEDRSGLDLAFADAMREVARQYPDDLDAATLFAEALMDTMPWNYWTEEGQARPATKEVLASLERVLKENPDHPGANHYYIHAVEASPNPERGLGAAYRLQDLCPGAGHLVHMPSHIFLRLGEYHQAALVNERAVAADKAYVTHCRVQGFYPASYYSHNMHFLWYACAMEGRAEDSLRAARMTGMHQAKEEVKLTPFYQWMKAAPLVGLARFGRWDEILREHQPRADLAFELAMWHYARGLAFARKHQPENAARELAGLEKLLEGKAAEALGEPNLPGEAVARVALTVLAAELAGLEGKAEDRVRRLEEAVKLEDALPYMEPPFWYFPTRQALGAALLEAGQPAKAEAVYRTDLRRHPRNGWSLFGLLQSLRAQGKTEEADLVQKQFREAWQHADTTLTASWL